MFEYHGWLNLQRSAGEDGDDFKPSTELPLVRELTGGLSVGPGLVDIRVVNGELHFSTSGFTNHRWQQVIDTFHALGKALPGSYGLLYVRDDEDPAGRTNEFQIFVMRRGEVTLQSDTFLSPCIPTIEDED